MLEQLLIIFGYMFFISLVGFAGSSQPLFYEVAVERTHWLTPHDFTTFLGFGFASPGPQLFSIATFIGYSAHGFSGALVATIAIYGTPCVLAVLTGRYLSRYIHHERADYFLKSVGLAAAGVLIAIGVNLLQANPLSVTYLLIAVGAFMAIAKWKVNPLFIIVAGGMLGGVLLR